MSAVAIAAVVVLCLAAGAAVGAAGTLLLLHRRERHESAVEQAEMEEELVADSAADLLTGTGVLALAASIPGVRIATQVARAGVEVRRSGLAPVVAESLRRIAEYAETDRPALRKSIADDGTVVLMFSDIEGSTALNERLGDTAWLDLLKHHNETVRRNVRRRHGQVVKTQGDSFMVVFRDLDDALHCAVDIQRDLEAGASGDAPLRVRIGIHRGEVVRKGRDVFGLNVALAARVAAEAGGGEVLASQACRDAARQLEGVRLARGRRVHLKGVSRPVTVYPVRAAEG